MVRGPESENIPVRLQRGGRLAECEHRANRGEQEQFKRERETRQGDPPVMKFQLRKFCSLVNRFTTNALREEIKRNS